jgi:DNA-binding transcriptional ArsR family regulator
MEKIVTVARAISCPTRLGILRLLGEQGRCLTEAARLSNVSVSTAAHHLSALMAAGLATKTVRGRKAVYRWSRSRWALTRMAPPAPTMPGGEPS